MERSVAIIGLGTFGIAVARKLVELGDRVLAIDTEETPISYVCEELDETVQADATNIKVLEEFSIDTYDAVVVSIGENLESSIVVALNLIELGCQNIWVKAKYRAQEKILRAIGVRSIILPEVDYGSHLGYLLHNPMVQDYVSLGDSKFISKLSVSDSMTGKTLSALSNDGDCIQCLGIYRQSLLISEQCASTTLEPLDEVLIFGDQSQLSNFADKLRRLK